MDNAFFTAPSHGAFPDEGGVALCFSCDEPYVDDEEWQAGLCPVCQPRVKGALKGEGYWSDFGKLGAMGLASGGLFVGGIPVIPGVTSAR